MVFPFTFEGTLHLENQSEATAVVDSVVPALRHEGARDVQVSHQAITFRGIETLTFSPLQNIDRGEIAVKLGSLGIELSYRIRMSLHMFAVSAIVLVVGLALAVSGLAGSALAMIGLVVVAISVGHSYHIRVSFPRWLKAIGDSPPAAILK
jgi:hypothetical protein